MLNFNQARAIAEMVNAVGEATRIQVIDLLAVEPYNVTDLSEAVGVPMVNMSHHLGVMRQAGLVEDLRDGRKKVYSLRSEVFTPSNGSNGTIGTIKVGSWCMMLIEPAEGGAKKRKK